MSSPRRVVVRLRPGSDGDATHIPKSGSHEQLDPPTLYLEKLAQQWMQIRGEAQPHVKYTLESLPAGYSLWQRPRPKDPKHLDRYLYGHPSHRTFDSPNRFFPHFQYLMENGDSIGCPCTVCSGSSGVLPKSASGSVKMRSYSGTSSNTSSRPSSATEPAPPLALPTRVAAPVPPVPVHLKGRPKIVGVGMDTSRVDEEGTPDIYRNLINKLRRHGKIDELIEEPLSMDWRAEQEILPDMLRKIKENQQWVPRVGDIVLYVRDLAEDVHIIRHPITADYRMYDERTKLWLDHPSWKAGLVGETPTEPITIEDVFDNGDKESNVTYSGLRVEPLPDVNSSDKSQSKRHRYVPVRHTRPFVLWRHLLHRVPKFEWHPTIQNAQTVTSVMSLTGKYRFKGTWPEAVVYCRGMYIGHEMLAVGDVVRLLPNLSLGQTTSTDILVVKSIRLKWSDLDNASGNDWDEERPYRSSVWIYGTAYTSDSSRMNKEWLSDAHPPAVADDYGEWYPLHPPSKELAVPYSRILGRLYERDALALWLNQKSHHHHLLDAGREGLMESRIFSTQNDNRIADKVDANWYWADSRAQALDLHTINGLDVSTRDQLRDPKDWRRKIKTMDGMTNNQAHPNAKLAGAPSLAGRSLRGFMAPALSDLPVRTQFSRVEDGTSTGSSVTGSSTTGTSSGMRVSKKRPGPHTANASSDEGEDEDDKVNEEIRQTMRMVEDRSKVHTKRARVTVVID
ncbi:hypothetical protein C7974DRAFT_113002 [Boeremia exigua]|uniref:uncharacterized protein n=1 Tax=Boeremia exigua TaxID=749465 RepID=UPI001E8E13EF|nr:uncharacterized protein C7974DRAFT_113002 [Boeremia exigua]KAH6642944.1 hypothetical protein C7974DRAFT_113002 [Boeremia exigua]